MGKPWRQRLAVLIGLELIPAGHREKLVSALGSLLGIIAIFLVNGLLPSDIAAVPLVASMGASAVLLFATPGSPLTQPWPLVGGHLLSALVGVSCQQLFSDPIIASCVAVPLAIAAMYYLHCIHPPGGATALLAILGGAEVEALGYRFLFDPILVDSLTLLLVAIVVNRLIPWRRYPINGASGGQSSTTPTAADLEQALAQSRYYLDISPGELAELYRHAVQYAEARQRGESD